MLRDVQKNYQFNRSHLVASCCQLLKCWICHVWEDLIWVCGVIDVYHTEWFFWVLDSTIAALYYYAIIFHDHMNHVQLRWRLVYAQRMCKFMNSHKFMDSVHMNQCVVTTRCVPYFKILFLNQCILYSHQSIVCNYFGSFIVNFISFQIVECSTVRQFSRV